MSWLLQQKQLVHRRLDIVGFVHYRFIMLQQRFFLGVRLLMPPR
jgi:hypothetical protein